MESLPTAPGPRRQAALYMAGGPPIIPTDPARLRAAARAALAPRAFAYCDGSAGRGETERANRTALEGYRVRPRLGRDVSVGDMGVTLFGRTLPAPLLVAPLGVQALAHAEADVATARGCAAAGVPMIFSAQGSATIEATAAAMGATSRWFQLYWSRSDALVASFVARAEAAGCEAIVVTLDAPLLGWRPEDLDLGHLPFLLGMGMANYLADPVFTAMLRRPPAEDMAAAVGAFLQIFANPGFTWDRLSALRAMTPLPLLVKGITHPDDARIALDRGVDGIIVSNHGGRQVDGAVAAATALDEIAPIVAGRVPLLFDSGVRGGADIFRALALGACAVLVGRPVFHALAVAGAAGVAALLDNLIAELDLTMRLSGCATIAAIDRGAIRREGVDRG